MKTITLHIVKDYLDDRKDRHFEDRGPLDDDKYVLSTANMTSYLGIKKIDFEQGTIETGEGILRSGVPFEKEESILKTVVTFVMEDDGVPCNENTLFIHLNCRNSANGERQEVDLPYREGASVTLSPHPYRVSVLRLNNEESELEVDDGKKATKHLVQLYCPKERDDEWSYATGNPNDPVDTTGPKLYMSLKRK